MYIRIKVKSNCYIFLWLKYITGFDITKHCAKCLTGNYSKLIQYRSQKVGKIYEGELSEYETPYAYLCGVTRNYDDNLHIAFKKSQGEIIAYEDKNVSVSIENAQKLIIPPVAGKSFSVEQQSCRNFQFGYHYLSDQL